MCFFRKRTIVSKLTLDQINLRLEENKKFAGMVENRKFEMRESIFFSNKFLFPIIKGTVEQNNDSTNVVVSFEISKCDKIGLSVFLLVILIIAVLFGILSSDVLLTGTILCFEIVLYVFFFMYWIHNCRRAYKKIFHLLSSKISN